jgi:hypothetical protein
MAIQEITAQRVVAQSGNTNVSSLDCVYPSAVNIGELMVVELACRSTGNITPPTGWSRAMATDRSSTNLKSNIFYKIAASGDGSGSDMRTFTFQLSVAGRMALAASAYTGAAGTSTLITAQNNGGTTGTTGLTTGTTPQSVPVGALIVGMHCNVNTSTWSSHSPTTEIQEVSNSGTASAAANVSMSTVINGSAGTKAVTANITTAREYHATIAAFAEDPVVVAPTTTLKSTTSATLNGVVTVVAPATTLKSTTSATLNGVVTSPMFAQVSFVEFEAPGVESEEGNVRSRHWFVMSCGW